MPVQDPFLVLMSSTLLAEMRISQYVLCGKNFKDIIKKINWEQIILIANAQLQNNKSVGCISF